MKQSVNLYKFERAFVDANRAEQFTYEGKKALFNYLENVEEDTEQEIELDVIALCCEYTEYESVEEYTNEYTPDVDKKDFDSTEDYNEAVKDYIRDNTTLIEIEDEEGFIIQQY